MKSIEKSIFLKVPQDIAYAAWMNYYKFPAYMPHVIDVKSAGGKRTRWTIDILGYFMEFETQLDQIIPNHVISWHSVSRTKHMGYVQFSSIDGGTMVSVRLLFETQDLSEDLIEDIDILWNEVEESADEALRGFKKYVEQMWQSTTLYLS